MSTHENGSADEDDGLVYCLSRLFEFDILITTLSLARVWTTYLCYTKLMRYQLSCPAWIFLSCLSICLFTFLSCLSNCLSVLLSSFLRCLSVCLSVYPFWVVYHCLWIIGSLDISCILIRHSNFFLRRMQFMSQLIKTWCIRRQITDYIWINRQIIQNYFLHKSIFMLLPNQTKDDYYHSQIGIQSVRFARIFKF